MGNKLSLIVLALSLLVLGGAILATPLLNQAASLSGADEGNPIKYGNQVCIYKNGQLVECKHNLFTERGRNHTRDILNARLEANGYSAINAIALSNFTDSIGAANTTIQNELTAANSGCGLHRQAGTLGYSTNSTGYQIGNWSYYKQFTNTCASIQVNVTGVFNTTTAAQAGEALFAVTTFSTVTLAPSDTLNVTWYMWVS